MPTEIMADTIALKIAGVNFVREFLDYTAVSYPFRLGWSPRFMIGEEKIRVVWQFGLDILRALTSMYYVIASNRYKRYEPAVNSIWTGLARECHRHLIEVPQYFDWLSERYSDQRKEIENERIPVERLTPCVRCALYRLGPTLGAYLDEFERSNEGPNFDEVITSEFEIQETEEKQIKDYLLSGTIRTDIMPSKLLHSYYSLYSEGNRPHYGTVIESIVRSRRHSGTV